MPFEEWPIDGRTYQVAVDSPLGSGSFGTVYRATSASDGDVAIMSAAYALESEPRAAFRTWSPGG